MSELDTMARTVWGEARGEVDPGMAAVAWVIKNRADKGGWWGSTIEAVCTKAWQFSCWNVNDPNRPKLMAVTMDDPCFAKAMMICNAVICGTIADPTGGATSYYERHMVPAPEWALGKIPTATIGNHVFFKV